MQVLTEEARKFIQEHKPPWANFYTIEPSGSLVYFEQAPYFDNAVKLYLRHDHNTKIRRVELPTHSVNKI